MAPARILLVEDDEDTRHLLALALRGGGYVVDQAATAPEGLERLRQKRYDLILTDYDLPGRTGSAMLREAVAQGLLHGAPMVVVTAHPQPDLVRGAAVMQKPLDIGQFLGQVTHILEEMAGVTAPDPDDDSAAAGSAGSPALGVDLVLYVSADSPASQRARSHLASVLSSFDAGQVRLEVCDVGEDAERAERDKVVFTPSLVARCGGLSTWVLGDLADRTLLLDLLHVCGLEPKTR
jgi:two-component system response regulator GlrR